MLSFLITFDQFLHCICIQNVSMFWNKTIIDIFVGQYYTINHSSWGQHCEMMTWDPTHKVTWPEQGPIKLLIYYMDSKHYAMVRIQGRQSGIHKNPFNGIAKPNVLWPTGELSNHMVSESFLSALISARNTRNLSLTSVGTSPD